MVWVLEKGLVKTRNFRVPQKKMKDQCLSDWFMGQEDLWVKCAW